MGGKKKKPGKKSSKKSGNAAETGSQKSRSEMGDSDDSENEGGVEPQSTESGPVETVPEAAATNDEAAEVAAAVAASAAVDPAPAKPPGPRAPEAPRPVTAPPAPEKPPFEGTEEEIAAAKKIQALQRGRQAREEFAKLKAAKTAEPEDALNASMESDAAAKDHRASQDAAMVELLRGENKKLSDSLADARVTIKLAEDKANAAQAELEAKTQEMDAKIAQADAKATEERERAERLEHQVEAFDKSAASAVGSATNERKAKVEAELERDNAVKDMEKEKAKAAQAVAEAAKKIADAEAKTAEERALYDATMKRAHDAEETVRESKEASLAMRAGLIRMATVMGDSREIRDFMRAMRAAEDSDEGSNEGIPGEPKPAADHRRSVNESSVAASADAARLVASNDDRGADELVDECIHKLHHFLSVNADEKKELRAQVQAQQRFSKDSVGGLGAGGGLWAASGGPPRSRRRRPGRPTRGNSLGNGRMLNPRARRRCPRWRRTSP